MRATAVFGGSALVFAWLLVAGQAKQAAPAPVSATATAPKGEVLQSVRQLVAIRHSPAGDRLEVLDVTGRHIRDVGVPGQRPQQARWSPDGAYLAYREGRVAYLNAAGKDPSVKLFDDVQVRAAVPYAFSPDSKRVAGTVRKGVEWVTVDGLGERKQYETPKGCNTFDLLWTQSGDALLALCFPAEAGSNDTLMLRIDPASGTAKQERVVKLQRLLGWRRDGGALIASDAMNVAGVLTEGAGLKPSFKSTTPEGEYILDYLPASDRLVTALGSEDPGDATRLRLRPLGGGEAQPWPKGHPHLTDLSFDAEGQWAAFVEPTRTKTGDPGGNLYVLEVGKGEAREVKAAKGETTWSAPVFRPLRSP